MRFSVSINRFILPYSLHSQAENRAKAPVPARAMT